VNASTVTKGSVASVAMALEVFQAARRDPFYLDVTVEFTIHLWNFLQQRL
jgi:hypothetical protein